MEPKEEIKQRIEIEQLVGEYVELKRAGRNYKGLSPFSAEKTPSFIVSPEKGIWHDFSSGKGGDIFSFVMEVEGLSFREALEMLARKAGVELKEFSPNDKKKEDLKAKIEEINVIACKYFQISLLKNKVALDYLKNRGIKKQAIIDFKLGYAPDNFNGLSSMLEKKGFTHDELKASGAVGVNIRSDKEQSYDIFRGRIMFPFTEVSGKIIGYTGRLISADGFGPKYMNTPQTLLYNKSDFLYGLDLSREAGRTNDRLVLLEGNMDVVAVNQAGFKEVVAASGTAVTGQQIRKILRYSSKLILCLDSDRAGVEATLRSLAIAAPTDLDISVATLPEGYKDPDELLQDTKSGGIERWKIIIDSAEDGYIWAIDKLGEGIDLNSPAQKGNYAAEALKIFKLIKNSVSQEGYRKYLASKLDVSVSSLESLIDQARSIKQLKRIRRPADDGKNKDESKNGLRDPNMRLANEITNKFSYWLALMINLDLITDSKDSPHWLDPGTLPDSQFKKYFESTISMLNKSNKVTKLDDDPEMNDVRKRLDLIYDDHLEKSSEPDEDSLIEDGEILIEKIELLNRRLKIQKQREKSA